MKTSTPVRLFVLCFAFIMLIAACGGDDEPSDTPPSDTDTVASSTGNEITAENADQVVNLLTIGRGMLEDIAVSPNGQWLSVITREGLWLYDLETGSERYLVSELIDLSVFSPDGNTLAGNNDRENIRIWNMAGDVVQSLENMGDIDQMAYSPDGRLLVTHQDVAGVDWVIGWSIESGELVVEVEGATSFAVSPDSQSLVVGLDDYSVGLIDLETGDLSSQWAGHTDVVVAVAFSPDGSTVVSGSDDETMRLWDAATGEALQTIETESDLTAVAYAPDGQTIMTTHRSRNRASQIWDVETGELVQVFDMPAHFMPDGQSVLADSRAGDLGIWDIVTGDLAQSFEGHSGRPSHLAVVADGQRVISTSIADGSVRQWDVATGETVRVIDGLYPANGIFAPDGQHLLSWKIGAFYDNEQLDLWDVRSGTVVREFSADEAIGLGRAFSTAFSADGRWLVSSTFDTSAIVWDVEMGEVKQRLDGDINFVSYAAFSPDSKLLSVVDRGRGMVWDVETGAVVAEYTPADRESLIGATSLDQKEAVQVMFLNGDDLEVWSPNVNAPLQMQYPSDAGDFLFFTPLYYVAPDGRSVVWRVLEEDDGQTVASDVGWQVFDVESGDTLQEFTLEESVLPFGISFSFDANYLLMLSISDDFVVVIDVATGETIQRLAVPDLTSAAWSPVNHLMVVANDEQVWLYDGVSGEELWTTEIPRGYVRQVKFSSSGDYFMSTGNEVIYNQTGTVQVFGVPQE